eukprot:scaffold45587_cov78-Phaeocystis_antarctica.AAC.1
MAILARHDQRRSAVFARTIGVGTSLQQRSSACLVALLARRNQRCGAAVRRVNFGARLQQRLSACLMATLARPHQRRPAVDPGTGRVGARLKQRMSASRMAILARKLQRRITCGATVSGTYGKPRLVSVRGKLPRGKLP